MSLTVLYHLLIWAYTVQSVFGLALSSYGMWDTARDLAASRHARRSRYLVDPEGVAMEVKLAYANELAADIGICLSLCLLILHALLLSLGLFALFGPPPPSDAPRTVASLRFTVVFIAVQAVAIAMQIRVIYKRARLKEIAS